MRGRSPFGSAMPASGDAGFDFGHGVIDDFNRLGAVPALVVLGPLERCLCFAQMPERRAHVGLIPARGLKPHAGNQNHQNNTCS